MKIFSLKYLAIWINLISINQFFSMDNVTQFYSTNPEFFLTDERIRNLSNSNSSPTAGLDSIHNSEDQERREHRPNLQIDNQNYGEGIPLRNQAIEYNEICDSGTNTDIIKSLFSCIPSEKVDEKKILSDEDKKDLNNLLKDLNNFLKSLKLKNMVSLSISFLRTFTKNDNPIYKNISFTVIGNSALKYAYEDCLNSTNLFLKKFELLKPQEINLKFYKIYINLFLKTIKIYSEIYKQFENLTQAEKSNQEIQLKTKELEKTIKEIINILELQYEQIKNENEILNNQLENRKQQLEVVENKIRQNISINLLDPTTDNKLKIFKNFIIKQQKILENQIQTFITKKENLLNRLIKFEEDINNLLAELTLQ
jgi:hypothetical protein